METTGILVTFFIGMLLGVIMAYTPKPQKIFYPEEKLKKSKLYRLTKKLIYKVKKSWIYFQLFEKRHYVIYSHWDAWICNQSVRMESWEPPTYQEWKNPYELPCGEELIRID